MKVIINRRFGGFDLSNTAIQLYIRKKNLGLYSNDDVNYYYVPVEEYNKQLESEELIQSGVSTVVTVSSHNIKGDECFNKLKEKCEIILLDDKSTRRELY